MHRTSSNWGPAGFLAASLAAATALSAAAPHGSWVALDGPLLVALAMVGSDLYLLRRRRYSLPRSRPSSSVLLSATALLVAAVIIATGDPDRLAGMVPILGSAVALPVLLRLDDARRSWRRPAGGVKCSLV